MQQVQEGCRKKQERKTKTNLANGPSLQTFIKKQSNAATSKMISKPSLALTFALAVNAVGTTAFAPQHSSRRVSSSSSSSPPSSQVNGAGRSLMSFPREVDKLLALSMFGSKEAEEILLVEKQKFAKQTTTTKNFLDNKINQIIDETFDDSDTNKNGLISVNEAYDIVLQIYVKINRQAPISPPTRSKVEDLFNNADMDKNGQIKRDEFKQLMCILASRASTRLLSHKFLTIVAAPLLALQTVHFLSGKIDVLKGVANQLVPDNYLETVTSEAFWETALTVLFVTTLGDTVLGASSAIYDRLIDKKSDDADL